MRLQYSYCCQICNVICKSGQSLSIHLKNKHKDYTNERYYLEFIAKDLNANKCKLCGKSTKFLGYSKGFCTYCSYKCQANDAELNKLRQNTARSHFNGNIRSAEGNERIKLANHLNKESRCKKAKETYKNKTGFEHPMENPEIKNKLKTTMQEKYGVEHALQYKEFLDKQKNTCLQKYGNTSYIKIDAAKEKIKNNNIKKYGVESPNSLDIVKEKKRQTYLDKYGTDSYTQTIEYIEKVKDTNNKKYGYDYHMQRPEYQEYYEQLCKERYGVKRYCQTEEFKEKTKQTCLEKYGNETFCGSMYAVTARKSKYKYNDIFFDSSWELNYYIWLIDNNVNFKYHPDISFKYECNNQIHYYYPDFLINDEFVEIKGDQFFDKNGNFINPYNKNPDIVVRYKAKYQCMLANNIKILKYSDLKEIIKENKTKYGKTYIRQFKL